MFEADTKDLKKLTDVLKNVSRSAYPLAVRGTLDSLAFETSVLDKKKVLPQEFDLRNSFIQGSVQYRRSVGTFDISRMASYAGQVSEYKGKHTDQLAKQEEGTPIAAKGAYTFAATPGARGGSYKKTIRKVNLFSTMKVKQLKDVVQNPTKNKNNEISQAAAFSARTDSSETLLLTNKKGKKGIYKVTKGRVTLLYRLTNKITKIQPTKWLEPAAKKIQKNADKYYIKNAKKRIEKEFSKKLKH